MEINIFLWLGAALPILMLLVLLVHFQVPAKKAAPAAMGVAVLTALILFQGDAALILVQSGKGAWNAFTIFLVIFPALLIYELSNEIEAFHAIKGEIRRLTQNELLQIMAIGWVFTSFLQGITGFGVPIAVGAPLLIGIGVKPIYAVAIPLLAHAWGGTFGTLAVGFEALIDQVQGVSDAEVLRIALWGTGFIWILNFIAGLGISWFYGRWKGLRKGFVAVVVISLVHGGGQMALSQVNPTLSNFIVACLGFVAIVFLGRLPLYRDAWALEDSPAMDRTAKVQENGEARRVTFHEAFLPYYMLTALTLTILLIGPVNRALGSLKFGFGFPEVGTGLGVVNPAVTQYAPIAPLTHAGTFLFAAAVFGYLVYRRKGMLTAGVKRRILGRVAKKVTPSTIAIFALIMMSRIMSGAGQTDVLARGVAEVLGQAYVFVSPSIGLLGGFMTSSNMSSNILFGEFQRATAEMLGLERAAILGAQTAGGAVGNSIAPGSIVLGTTTAGIMGREGEVLRKNLPFAIGIAIIIGLLLHTALQVFS